MGFGQSPKVAGKGWKAGLIASARSGYVARPPIAALEPHAALVGIRRVGTPREWPSGARRITSPMIDSPKSKSMVINLSGYSWGGLAER